MTIYLDAIWFLNLCVDLMLLLLAKGLARDGAKLSRIFLGAFVASLIVPITIYFPTSVLNGLAGKFVFSTLIILCTFGFSGISRFLKLLLLFYFVTFSIGGGLTAIHFLVSNPVSITGQGILTFNSGYGDPVSWIFILVGFPIVWYFTKRRMDEHVKEKIKYDQMLELTIQIDDKAFCTIGYIDSGNQLVDPLTKKPVVICDEKFLGNWFSEKDWKELKEVNETLAVERIPSDWESRIQIVPYHGVQGSNMFMLAIRPDFMSVEYEGQKIETSNFLIGINFGSLDREQRYHCLLHPQIIKFAAVQSA